MNRPKRDLGTGDLCDNIGVVGVSAKWSYVTASPSHHDKAIPILLFMHVGHLYIPLFKIHDLLVVIMNMLSFTQVTIEAHPGEISELESGSDVSDSDSLTDVTDDTMLCRVILIYSAFSVKSHVMKTLPHKPSPQFDDRKDRDLERKDRDLESLDLDDHVHNK